MSFPRGFTRVVMGASVCMILTWRPSARFVGLLCWRLMGMPLAGQENGLAFLLVSLLCIDCLAGLLCKCVRIKAAHGGGKEDQYIGLLSLIG